MIKVIKHPELFNFVGDPILFELQTDNLQPIIASIHVGSDEIPLSCYPHGSQSPYTAELDVSGVLEPYFDRNSSINGDQIIISELTNFVLDCHIKIDNIDYPLKVIHGGTSHLLLNEFDEYNYDYFSYRLNNPERQILFTTRTNGPHISLRESEIFPFVFLHPGKPITFESEGGHELTTQALSQGTACLMDINTLRKTFYELYEESPLHISVLIDTSFSFDISITPSTPSENSHIIRFRNSLGGFEDIEMTGDLTFSPEFLDENLYLSKNKIARYEEYRDRIGMKYIYGLNSGYKSVAESFHILDMLGSDLCFIIFPDKSIKRCTVTPSDDIDINLPLITPSSIQMDVRLVDEGLFYSPPINLDRPGAWILETGIWNDFNRWKDNKYWIDN